MPDKPSDFEPQTLWQSQPTEHDPMTVAAIHQKALVFQARIRRRNLIEYIAAAVVTVAFATNLFNRASWMMQAGAALMITATVFIVWQLHRRGSAAAVPPVGGALVDFHRRELIRQRDALRSVAVWYLAPFVPGFVMMSLGRWFQAHTPHRAVGLDHRLIIVGDAIAVLIFLGVWLLNLWGARRLQRLIDELR